MSRAIEGAVLLGGAAALGTAAFFDPALVGSPLFDKAIASLALGGISMEAGAIATALLGNQGNAVTVRQPAAYRPIVYGTRQVGGSMIYLSTTGSHHDQFNFVIVLAAHEVNAIQSLYLDGRKVFWEVGSNANTTRNGINFGGQANSNTYVGPDGSHYNFGGLVFCEARFGDQVEGDVIASLTANDPTWAASSNGSPWVGGCCYVYLKIEYDANMFPQQPQIRFVVQGKNDILDPRTGTTGFTDNWALCVADVLQNPIWGLGAAASEINTDQLIGAANVCDEQIPLANPATEGGATESQWTCNWTGDTSSSPGDILAQMMPAAAGRISRVGGQYYIWPAYFQGPSFTFDQSALTGTPQLSPNRSIRDLYNRVKGTYVAPWFPYSVAGNLYDSNGFFDGSTANLFNLAWQPTDYPYYAQDALHGFTSDAFLAEDGGRTLYKDLNQQACISVATAQRAAKVDLMRNRFQQTATLPMTLAAYRMMPTDVMTFTFAGIGWDNQMLEVNKAGLSVTTQDGTPSLGTSITVNQTDPSIYEWSVTEEQTIDDVPALTLIPPYTVDPPTNLTLSHQSVSFGLGASGSGILVSWTPSDDAFVVSTAIQYMVSGGTTWISAGSVPQTNTQSGIAPLGSGTYNVEIYAVRANGATSPTVEASITF
ncbi:hypothetical protein HNQ77_002663 [Silvibacterium bohemicum]|uniref:Uncharacterized protein n=1 Tax=Silvibacterium bohemicum TaxID=1577686 RepID=A0A841JW74_9BACT|nr:fibronectin type III domain-containing protein [Silvibacterium bohemicum]MBB6144707.1 hypothetical protein [Silvibacterium bohemicum]